MEDGSHKTEIPAASGSDCPVLSCLVSGTDAGASWFSQNHQRQRNPQLEELARTLARQVTLNVAPLMRTDSPDEKRIQAILDQLTDESRILDAGVYDEQGDLIARSGESVEVRDRLALDGKKQAAILTSRLSSQLPGKTDRSAICA